MVVVCCLLFDVACVLLATCRLWNIGLVLVVCSLLFVVRRVSYDWCVWLFMLCCCFVVVVVCCCSCVVVVVC